jgi:hypothetical protein
VGDGRLGQGEHLGRTGEAAVLDDACEYPELAKRDASFQVGFH